MTVENRIKVAYISGPHSAPHIYITKQNIKQAEAAATKYWQMGYGVICPHMNSAMLDGMVQDTFWLEAYLEILSRCNVCVMLPGWSESERALAEYKLARKLGLEIIYE